MSGTASQGLRVLAISTALFLLTGQGWAVSPQARLQQIADEAALAAVQILGTSGRPADAVEAAKQTVAAVPGVTVEVSASPADLVVTVKLSGVNAKAAPVVSTARYLPPDQPATWGWASRQRFAVKPSPFIVGSTWKPSPFIVGSTCLRDCEPNPLR